jgi:hypothetical protein
VVVISESANAVAAWSSITVFSWLDLVVSTDGSRVASAWASKVEVKVSIRHSSRAKVEVGSWSGIVEWPQCIVKDESLVSDPRRATDLSVLLGGSHTTVPGIHVADLERQLDGNTEVVSFTLEVGWDVGSELVEVPLVLQVLALRRQLVLDDVVGSRERCSNVFELDQHIECIVGVVLSDQCSLQSGIGLGTELLEGTSADTTDVLEDPSLFSPSVGQGRSKLGPHDVSTRSTTSVSFNGRVDFLDDARVSFGWQRAPFGRAGGILGAWQAVVVEGSGNPVASSSCAVACSGVVALIGNGALHWSSRSTLLVDALVSNCASITVIAWVSVALIFAWVGNSNLGKFDVGNEIIEVVVSSSLQIFQCNILSLWVEGRLVHQQVLDDVATRHWIGSEGVGIGRGSGTRVSTRFDQGNKSNSARSRLGSGLG